MTKTQVRLSTFEVAAATELLALRTQIQNDLANGITVSAGRLSDLISGQALERVWSQVRYILAKHGDHEGALLTTLTTWMVDARDRLLDYGPSVSSSLVATEMSMQEAEALRAVLKKVSRVVEAAQR